MEKLRAIVVLWGVIAMLGACSANQGPASAKLDAPSGKTARVGETIELNAAESVYDEISWFVNGNSHDGCNGQVSCSFAFHSPGTYEISIEVLVAATDATGLGAGVAGTPETTDNTSITLTVVAAETPPPDLSASVSEGDSGEECTPRLETSNDLSLVKDRQRNLRSPRTYRIPKARRMRRLTGNLDNHWIFLTYHNKDNSQIVCLYQWDVSRNKFLFDACYDDRPAQAPSALPPNGLQPKDRIQVDDYFRLEVFGATTTEVEITECEG